MKKNKLISILLCFSMLFFGVFATNIEKAKAAGWAVGGAVVGNAVVEGANVVADAGSLFQTLLKKVVDIAQGILVTASKVAALMIVQKITQAIIGKGDGGKDAKGGVITDWDQYLNIEPQQKAMAQMNSFFNNATKGRSSSLNYEGVNNSTKRIQSYLVTEGRKAYTPQKFAVDIQETVTDSGDYFGGGNMKGIMAYTKCANNVPCMALTSAQEYNSKVNNIREIAIKEQDRGILPVKKDGVITQPAAIAGSALSQIDQLGTTLIMNADYQAQGTSGALTQIGAGIGVSVASRSLNYALSDKEGKNALKNKNDQPFSIGYSIDGGIGISGAGVNVNTGSMSVSGQMMIGNTCATAGSSISGGGGTTGVSGTRTSDGTNTGTVKYQGKTYDCATKGEVTTVKPSVTITKPTVTVTEATVSTQVTQ
ncbi:MAG: hypothetical protein ACD_8C00130G0002 [uncultured bacterium]|nr:MAG: hypothetical protein ACD_8C00130G0002 [uncultured bacterium]